MGILTRNCGRFTDMTVRNGEIELLNLEDYH